MRVVQWTLVPGLMLAAGAVNAQVSATVTATSDYDFRGISQSAKDPALQASLDYAMDNGWYVGAWASNVDFGDDTDYEIDLYTGFSGGGDGSLLWDVGLIYYAFPDSSEYDFLEAYAGIGNEWLEGKLWYANDYGGDETDGNTSAFYLEGNATIALPRDFSLLLHVGLSTGDYWDDEFGDDLIDYSIGVGYTLGNFELALKYIDAETDIVERGDVLNNEGRFVFAVSTTFPWKD